MCGTIWTGPPAEILYIIIILMDLRGVYNVAKCFWTCSNHIILGMPQQQMQFRHLVNQSSFFPSCKFFSIYRPEMSYYLHPQLPFPTKCKSQGICFFPKLENVGRVCFSPLFIVIAHPIQQRASKITSCTFTLKLLRL